MEKITAQLKIEETVFKSMAEKIDSILNFKAEIEKVLTKETTKILEVILAGAISLDASDIHIEPEEKEVKTRVRIDGMLHDVIFTEFKIYQALLSRIKLLSGIKLNITEKAQDGRFTILTDKNETEARVSVLPSEYGESIVIRLLNPKKLIKIEDLGVREEILGQLRKEIEKPNGMIIVTGPTGSGKTTTLYAVLEKVKKPGIKIITIEDPIEYHLEGVSQTQAAPEKGYDFPNGLRAIVRQDPDVILIGEIRDYETAKIALQSALTGHLVLTTLHTNDAAGTIVRLQSLGEKAINIAPAINIAVAQRLVRKVCKKCVKFSHLTEEELQIFKKELCVLGKKIKIPKLSKNLKIPRVKGCKFCNFTGYKGRIGIFEFFLKDDEMENFILKSPSIADLRKIARKKGMIPMREDGLIKVLQGITTLEEIKRVTAS
jgi:type IV pilus assembly protein PilB